jgi:hypothetical protein
MAKLVALAFLNKNLKEASTTLTFSKPEKASATLTTTTDFLRKVSVDTHVSDLLIRLAAVVKLVDTYVSALVFLNNFCGNEYRTAFF